MNLRVAVGSCACASASLTIGQYYANGPTPAWTIHLDDVVVNETP